MIHGIPKFERTRGGQFDAHANWFYMQCRTTQYPGLSGRFYYLDWNGSTFSPSTVDEYVYDTANQNCCLAGERVPVYYDYELQRLEITGSHGLVRNLLCDVDIEPGSQGAAYLLDRTNTAIPTALVIVTNTTSETIESGDRIGGIYHFAGGIEKNTWVTVLTKGAGASGGRCFYTGSNGVPAAIDKLTPSSAQAMELRFNGTQFAQSSQPPNFVTIWNGAPTAIRANDVVQCKRVDGIWLIDVEYCRTQDDNTPPPP